MRSPPSREAWIEINKEAKTWNTNRSRLPHGRRGLKYVAPDFPRHPEGRLPHGRRGLKLFCFCLNLSGACRLPHGRRGLKSPDRAPDRTRPGRLPHGRRGLKYLQKVVHIVTKRRLPHGRRGLKCACGHVDGDGDVSPPSREAWIEIRPRWSCGFSRRSPPSREAWIEIPPGTPQADFCAVASLTGGVD